MDSVAPVLRSAVPVTERRNIVYENVRAGPAAGREERDLV